MELPLHGNQTPEVTLRHNQRDLTFDFVPLHFSDPRGNRCFYRLDPFDSTWREAGTERRATYTNLEPGAYSFHVKASTGQGIWNESDANFGFTIEPPFWRTLAFYISSFLWVITGLGTFYRWRVWSLRQQEVILQDRVTRQTRELQEALELVERQAATLRELDKAKSRFFADVAHEFRTPLTLVLGPLEDLQEGFHGPLLPEVVQHIELANRAARRLLRLINQLLEVAKIEDGQLRLQAREIDLCSFLKEHVQFFQPLAGRRDIDLVSSAPNQVLEVFWDEARLEEVLSNLLANAFKFTHDGGEIRIRVAPAPDEEYIEVEIEDTGVGIPADSIGHIFDRFYHSDDRAPRSPMSTGLGLSVTKELVELHGGKILVQSEPEVGSIFTLRLRRGKKHLRARDLAPTGQAPGRSNVVGQVIEELSSIENDADAVTAYGEPKPRDQTKVLIVEDHEELRLLLKKHLSLEYRVVEAGNGVEALELARNEIPDLIVSDVLMPEMNGYDLCSAIREDPELDFIPVILLTAKVELEDKLQGLERGADDYLTKPFSAAELKVRVANLIGLRRQLKIRFAGSEVSSSEARLAKRAKDATDRQFLERVQVAIEENMENEDFGVQELAWELALSRVHLYRKLREILSQAPAEVILSLRLQRAAFLLKTQPLSVSEVAYGVGFKSVSHFTKRFGREYGVTPSSFRARGFQKPALESKTSVT